MNRIYEDVANYIGVLQDSDPESNRMTRTQLGVAIDSALGVLVQNGIGHNTNLMIEPNLTWDDFLYGHLDLENGIIERAKINTFVRSFVCISALISYDPPQASVLNTLKEARDENLTRAKLEVEFAKIE